MRKKRENHEITDQEYIEWKLNYKLNNPLKWSENSNIPFLIGINFYTYFLWFID
jgi:hypothetical protein